MYDSCNCEKSEDCMCAAVSSYVHACAAAGIMLNNWGNTICSELHTPVYNIPETPVQQANNIPKTLCDSFCNSNVLP